MVLAVRKCFHYIGFRARREARHPEPCFPGTVQKISPFDSGNATMRNKEERGNGMNGLYIRGVRIDWANVPLDSYLREIPSLQGIEELKFDCPVTFFTGENGSGKSTLLEAIAVSYGLNPEGGSSNYSFSTYDSHSRLYDAVTLYKGIRHAGWSYFLRAESFYNVATAEEEYSKGPGGRPMRFHERSHGESFLALVRDFRGNALYLLDEPEAALSPQKQLEMLLEIRRLAVSGAQLFIATHSPILLGYPGAEILSFDGDVVRPVAYRDTESYRITNAFLTRYDRMIRDLFPEDNR